jgi:hypothetical protein
MSYTLIYDPPWTFQRVLPKAVFERTTAAEAWSLLQEMYIDYSSLEIKDLSGKIISLRELQNRAAREIPLNKDPWG